MIFPNNFSVIVPAFNEAETVQQVIGDILHHCPQAEVIVVDDGSTDQTAQQLLNLNITVVHHPFNKGYGAAIKTGIGIARHDIIVTVDADGQHAIADINRFVREISDCDMVVGRRKGRIPLKFINRMGKAALAMIASFALGYRIPDINSGFRVFRKKTIEKFFMSLPDTFSFHASSTLHYFFNGLTIKYVVTRIYPRQGHSKVFFVPGLKSLFALLRLVGNIAPQRLWLMGLFFLFIPPNRLSAWSVFWTSL